jgi:hypothetical protein
METARLFLSGANATDLNITPVPILHHGTMHPEGSRIFRKHGYASLDTYLLDPDEADRLVIAGLLSSYADSVVETILEHFQSSTGVSAQITDPSPSTLCVVGHAIYLPAAALKVATMLQCCSDSASLQAIRGNITREAEGYLIDILHKSVRYVGRSEK